MQNKKIIISLICVIITIVIIGTLVLLNKKNNDDINKVFNGTYIFKTSGGSGEVVYNAYVYKDENMQEMKYKYVLTTAATTSWGSTEWEEKTIKEGFANNLEEIKEIIQEHTGRIKYIIDKDETVKTFDEFIEEFSD